MSNGEDQKSKGAHRRWAEFRFGVVGGLLSAPPAKGDLNREIQKLAQKIWRHPITGEPRRFGRSTIERWHSMAQTHERQSPVDILRRKVRKDSGSHPGIDQKISEAIRAQYGLYPFWSARLHHDNLKVKLEKMGAQAPSLSTLKRYLRDTGMKRRRKPKTRDDGSSTPGAEAALARLMERETRSYESEFVGGLWHLDFHACSRKVLTGDGAFVTPVALGVIDDHSRLLCHLQWYLAETTENLVHGLSQALMRRRLPRSLMTDNGGAMQGEEFLNGLILLGIVHDTTLPYSPHQNGKQESFWSRLEGRLIAMLSRVRDLSLKRLNDLTFAWAEQEYNSVKHEETGEIPRERYQKNPSVLRPCPEAESLQGVFRCEESRTQRHSDGTLTILGRRFEVPSRFRHMSKLRVRFAEWDLSYVSIVDPRTGVDLCRIYPLDKVLNANGIRRRLDPLSPNSQPIAPREDEPEIPALLEKLIKQQEQTGLPPAYLPKSNEQNDPNPTEESGE